jgi:hypothetical protein
VVSTDVIKLPFVRIGRGDPKNGANLNKRGNHTTLLQDYDIFQTLNGKIKQLRSRKRRGPWLPALILRLETI